MAFRYTQEVMVILIRQFQSPDEEMKKIVLKVRRERQREEEERREQAYQTS